MRRPTRDGPALDDRTERFAQQHYESFGTFGLAEDAVIEERRRRGISAFRRQRAPIEWSAAMLRLLGTDTDATVAAELGIRKQDVFRKRRILGIPSHAVGTFRPPGFHWSARALVLLGGPAAQ